ncbi:DUF3048 domain-containing protein [Promineifilum sp.]|uniref:DUF3048 domain-containing protein n=1 Tax=Promineifilum sp. TaxID=2664178 RepID=UPI0035B30209
MLSKRFALLLVIVALFAVACGGSGAQPGDVPAPPTGALATAQAEVEATITPVPPTATTAATPTLPPAVVVTPEVTLAPPTPEVTPAPDTVVLANNAEAFAGRNPLTGEEVDDPTVLERRPIAVKLANAPADYTRPQAGLNDADIIFEHWTEGAVTRFTAIFYDTVPPNVGPVRSARLIDVELPAMYDAMLAFSGASVGVNRKLNASDFADRLLRASEPGFYRTGDTTKAFEHTLYIRMADLWAAVEAKGLNTAPHFNTFNAFTEEPPAGGSPAGTINISYKTEEIEWVYDEAIGQYRRWMDFEEHLDANTEEQVTVSNVIYLNPFHVNDPDICEQITNGVCAALSIEIQLWGSGPAVVFRDGQRYDVTWHRDGRNDQLTFTDAQGNPFPLQIGQSWVQVVPSYIPNSLTVAP